MRYENPMYFAEDAAAADLIADLFAGGRLQLGISRGSPEQVIDGCRYFGYAPADGDSDAEMARQHSEAALGVLEGNGFPQPNPRPMFANPPGLLRIEPHSFARADLAGDRGSRDQIGMIDDNTRAIFGRSYAAEPDVLVEQLRTDEAIQAADTLLLTVPNQLGVEYNAHLIEDILTHVAPGLGWR